MALGVFDGVHRAHQQMLRSVVGKARSIRGTSVVVTFSPDPHRERSLYSLEHRLRLISRIGVEVCIVINFSKKFSQVSAEDFIKDILARKINAAYVYVGRNFRFGRNGKGDNKTLERFAKVYHYRLKLCKVIKVGSRSISSTVIRKLIFDGKLGAAGKLLSRPVSVLGTVVKGDSLGKRLGFPTANIDPHHEVLPPSGIYIVNIVYGKRILKGVCYIGVKPTFKSHHVSAQASTKGTTSPRHQPKDIEVNIFDFYQNIYGKYLEVQFIKKIREDRKFSSQELLARQIKKDIFKAQVYFSRHR